MNNYFMLCVLCIFGLGACASAQVFYQDQQGGILTVSGSEEGMMAAAQERMAAHCGSRGYTIVKRFTVIVGSESYSQTNYQDVAKENKTKVDSAEASSEAKVRDTHNGSKQSANASQTNVSREANQKVTTGEERSVSNTRDLTEHRVAYRCGT